MKIDFKSVVDSVVKTVRPKMPEVLGGCAIGFTIAAVLLAVKQTYEFKEDVEELKKKKVYVDLDGEPKEGVLTKKETALLAAKRYYPVGILVVLDAACVIGSLKINHDRISSLLAACAVSNSALKEYKEAAKEVLGQKKQQEIQSAIDDKKLKEKPVETSNVIHELSDKRTLFFEPLSGRYFRSDIESVRKALNDLNAAFMYEAYITLNDWYDMLDIPRTELGDNVGWNGVNGLVDIGPDDARIASNGEPCIALVYHTEPTYDYTRFR
ncbi:MAG: hypothetical protein J6O18_05150 [Bacilli bacterium]|nr:hypothetical protein [Bacilli bacterium]